MGRETTGRLFRRGQARYLEYTLHRERFLRSMGNTSRTQPERIRGARGVARTTEAERSSGDAPGHPGYTGSHRPTAPRGDTASIQGWNLGNPETLPLYDDSPRPEVVMLESVDP